LPWIGSLRLIEPVEFHMYLDIQAFCQIGEFNPILF